MKNDITALREQINDIDAQLVTLLNKRAEVALAVGEVKAATGQQVYDPVREGAVFQRIDDLNQGPLDKGAMEEVFRTIIAACREIQARS